MTFVGGNNQGGMLQPYGMAYRPYSGQGKAGASGTVEVDLTPPPGYEWMVYHIGIGNTSSTNSTLSVYLNQRFLCGSNLGNADSADGTPISVRSIDTLRFVWNGVSNGAVCTVQILVQEGVIGHGVVKTYG